MGVSDPAGGPRAAFAIRGRGRSRPISYSTTRAGARDGRHKAPPDDDDTDSATSRRSSSCGYLIALRRTRGRRRLPAARDAKGGQPRIGAVSPSSAPFGTRRVISGYVNQGREMTVPVTEFEGLNLAGTGVHRIADHVGSHLGESCVSILLPDLV